MQTKPDMKNKEDTKKQNTPRFIMCNCTGECPGFKDMNFWQLLNYVRNELGVAYAVIHPQLCVDDGERFFADILKDGSIYVIGGCDPRMQKDFGNLPPQRASCRREMPFCLTSIDKQQKKG